MVAGDDDAPPEARPAGLDNLVFLCRALNEASARYVVIGGMAIIEAGFVRATEDIDLLVEASPQNLARVRTAMMALPHGAVCDVADGDLDAYVVVRVADEFVVDLMKAACGVEYERARHFITSPRGTVTPRAPTHRQGGRSGRRSVQHRLARHCPALVVKRRGRRGEAQRTRKCGAGSGHGLRRAHRPWRGR